MDESGRGFFENAVGFVEPGVFIEGRRVERVDDDTYRVEGGKFTSCAQPNPRWGFTASSGRDRGGRQGGGEERGLQGEGGAGLLRALHLLPHPQGRPLHGLPLPPLRLLVLPRLQRGHRLLLGDGPQRRPDLLRRQLLEGRLRLRPRAALRARTRPRGARSARTSSVRARRPTPRPASPQDRPTDYDIDWNALQMLPGKVRATVNVRKYSDLLFHQRFQDDFNRATNRTERWSGALEKDLRLAVPERLRGHHQHLLRHRLHARQRAAARRLPAPLPAPGRLGRGRVRARRRPRTGSSTATRTQVDNWSRYDVAPTSRGPSRSASSSSTPRSATATPATARATGWTRRTRTRSSARPSTGRSSRRRWRCGGRPSPASSTRPGFGYSERFKHTIGPEVSWTYRTRVEDFNSIPKFDGDDYFLGTNQIAYSLVQRFYAKRRGPTGKAAALRVLQLAADADLLRPDRGRAEQLRPELLVLRVRPRLQARAPLAPHVAHAAAALAGRSPSTSTSSTTSTSSRSAARASSATWPRRASR